jgi:hypothetical protein
MRDDDDDDDAGDNSEEDEYFYVDCEPVVFHCDGWDMNIFGSNISTFINGTLEDVD